MSTFFFFYNLQKENFKICLILLFYNNKFNLILILLFIYF